MGRLPIYGKISNQWEVFPTVGLPTYGKSSIYGKSAHIWEVFPHMESHSCMVTNMFGDQQHASQGLWRGQGHEGKPGHANQSNEKQARGRPTGGMQGAADGQPGYTPHNAAPHPHIYGKSSQMCEVFPYVGSLPTHGKSSHVCEVSPHTRRLPIYGETPHI
jgi:hypothetical protein